MHDLIINFGYPALFLGCLLEGESVLIAAGFLARSGYLDLNLVMLIALAATYTADVTIYFLGRHKGEGIISKFPVAKTYYPKVKTLFDKYGIWAIFITRYLYGLRLAAAGSMGLMRMKKGLYLPFDLLSCTIWAILIGSLGYMFGASLEALIGQIKHYEKIVVLFIIIIGLGIWLIRRVWSKRKSEKVNQIKEEVKS
ncbi:MAG: DedA family protein [candidate division Zixibacteria bacterium]|nr:DedA family protein [candidate division Zixibacteria bacterium]